ncbi:Ubiquitin carboxyl-terminal hydrolase CYLD [Papilio machaon]|uniref:ubiquitinyl hydrolase 1 n=1 Tax=Papilio machaon TaxID=76193 RepID=A0A0N1PHP3_PAPMA|nr:Ubiquitin carboxyl-terminal hydrolase CYLD [Papilio machaon]
MSNENNQARDSTGHNRDTQLDLFSLIGGSWPPAPREPEQAQYGTVPKTYRRTMQRPSQNERIKSVNLINHLAPEKRRNRPNLPSTAKSLNPEEVQRPTKMVNEPEKVETGILVDVPGADAPEQLYDSPALGSPRSAQPKSSPVHAPEDIGVGSLVEVATDVDQHYYGVVKWIGIIDDTATAGVELEESVCGLGDGSRGGAKLFSCAPGRALFVPLPLCRRDARFRDTPPPDRADLQQAQHYDQPDCPIVTGVVPPLSSLGTIAGKNRGIQGHHNSCYLDATLFAMFTFTSVFDSLLYRPPEPEDSPHYSEVQRVLREEVVNPLRRHGYVRADRVMKLRTLLERLSDVPGLTSEEKDPEEFLNGLVAQILRAEPFLKLSSGQESYCYQVFVERDRKVTFPSVQCLVQQSFRTSGVKLTEDPEEFLNGLVAQILRAEPFLKLSSGQESYCYQVFVERDRKVTFPSVQCLVQQSFRTSGVKLTEVPSTLIIQMPRFGKQYKSYERVLPTPHLDITDLIEGLPQQCVLCGALATWECGPCQRNCEMDGSTLCDRCLRLSHPSTPRHRATPLKICEDMLDTPEPFDGPRVFMELFAVLCIETSHYVAFVKTGVGHDAPWCFFDSMADRKGERNGYNIPEIVPLPELGACLAREGACERQLPAYSKRLLSDAYMCFYRNHDVAMYR